MNNQTNEIYATLSTSRNQLGEQTKVNMGGEENSVTSKKVVRKTMNGVRKIIKRQRSLLKDKVDQISTIRLYEKRLLKYLASGVPDNDMSAEISTVMKGYLSRSGMNPVSS